MSSGYILQQNVVCCRHINDNTSTAVNVKIPFDGIVYDPNNLWSKDSDEFFAPVTGVYLAHVNLMTDSSSYDSGNHELRVNGNVFSPRLRGYGVGTGQAQHKNANSHSMVKLQAGDRLSVVSVNASIWYGSATYAHSHVSIHLISDV
jgi:hypothetical protein